MKAGDSRTLPARSALSRVLKDAPVLTALPIAHRLSPATLALAALAGRPLCSPPLQPKLLRHIADLHGKQD